MSPETSTQRSDWNTVKTLFTYLWPKNYPSLRIRVVVSLTALVIGKLINVSVPFFYKGAVDALSGTSASILFPLGVILAYGTARVGQQVFGEIRDFVFVRVSQHAQRYISLQTFQHLHQLSLSFHLDRQTGGLTRIIERGKNGIQTALFFVLFNIIPTIFEIILVTIVLSWKYSSYFSLVILITIAAYIAYSFLITDWRVKYRRTMNQKDTEANTKAVDSLLNYETVKYFCNEEHEYRRFDETLAQYEKAAIGSQKGLSVLNVGQAIIIGVGLIILMVMAGKRVTHHTMTVGDFVMVNTYLIQLYLPLNFLGFVYREVKQNLIDMENMFELWTVHQEIQDAPNAKPLQITGGSVEFRDVVFGYQKERTILKKISFTVPPGKSVAIVGPSGAGKSTISRILFRFYDVNSGGVFIDGQEIRSVTQKSLRQNIGIVPQDTVLFNDTIFYNIQYGRPEASEEEVKQAASLAKIDTFVRSLPKGYETVVGERGLKLSGGEKQRVAIARTILKNPSILLFDEATSALDSKTEKEIQVSLDEVSKDHTSLVIAHRLSTVVHSDQILVLKDGEIVERGRHEELLKMNGEYASMWQKQQSSFFDSEKSEPTQELALRQQVEI